MEALIINFFAFFVPGIAVGVYAEHRRQLKILGQSIGLCRQALANTTGRARIAYMSAVLALENLMEEL